MTSATVRHVDDVIASFDDVTALSRWADRRGFDSAATTLALLHPAMSESHRRSDVTVTWSRPEVVLTPTRTPAVMASQNFRIVSSIR